MLYLQGKLASSSATSVETKRLLLILVNYPHKITCSKLAFPSKTLKEKKKKELTEIYTWV